MRNCRYYQSLYGRRALWRRLGFGVHSPFAYKLITQVVGSPGYSYYAEELLSDEPLLRLLYRLAVSYPIVSLEVSPSCEDIWKKGSDPLQFVKRKIQSLIPIEPQNHPNGPFDSKECYALWLWHARDPLPSADEVPDYTILLVESTSRDRQPCLSLLEQRNRGLLLSLNGACLLILNPKIPLAFY